MNRQAIGFLCLNLLGVLVWGNQACGDSEGQLKLPLKVSMNRRFLVDQEARPVLIVGDAAWSLIANLKSQDIKTYLKDRQKRGFNAIMVNLIEHKFTNHPPRNQAGLEPFTQPGDFSTPNEPYFDFAYKTIEQAGEHGMVVWLYPAYLGWKGGDEGFFKEIEAGGREKLRAYGNFVGKRFKDLGNIVWVVGGDYAMPANHRWTAADLAEAIREGGANQLITAHGGQQSAVEAVGDQPWLSINTTYSYQNDLFHVLWRDYERRPNRPFVLIESIYENEHDSRPEQIRRQAYWAITCGACGQFFGNNPIWHFDGPGLFPSKGSWRESLDEQGSRDMSHLRAAFVDRPWHQLVPDLKNTLVPSGRGEGTRTITAALASDGTLAMVYVPSTGTQPREFGVDLSRLSGPVRALWFNPADGKTKAAADEPLPNQGMHLFRTAGDNGTKTNDWLLILEIAHGR